MLKALPRVIAVVGATATGKTAVSVLLAKQLNTEIISCDSQLVYQGLDIGTAKPTQVEQQGIAHHLMDCVLPTQKYSAAMYVEQATPVLEQLWQSEKCPIVTGGTGFYLKALLEGKTLPPVPPDPAFRNEMQVLADTEGVAVLYQRLHKQDPRRAAQLHPNDVFRVIRALEIIHHSGQRVPCNKVENSYPFQVIWLGLQYADRDRMRTRIDRRIDTMLEQGWLEEVKQLMEAYGSDAAALQVAHGYPEWVRHLKGELSFKDALAQVQMNIHQYARRQLTWFRRNLDIFWIDVDTAMPEEICEVFQSKLQQACF